MSIRQAVRVLWGYRRVVWSAVIGVSALFAMGVLLAVLVFPAERLASIPFRLLFDGAAQGKYPNGTAFSPAEIVADPVLTEVYKANDVQRFGEYQDFEDAMFVLQSNPDLDLLTAEYQGRLADTNLTPVDRARVEEEFRRKREALRDPVFSLNLRRHERLTAPPREVAETILTDTLATWARQVVEQKGATRYNVPVFSRNILDEGVLESEDYLIGVDILRVKAQRVIESIDELEKLPGAEIIRTGDGRVSLPEVRANLEDVLRFGLEPLLGIIRSKGVTKNARTLSLYANNQRFQLGLERDVTAAQIRSMQDALREYSSQRAGRPAGDIGAGMTGARVAPGFETPALIPQFGESFLNRLVEMSTLGQTSDVLYRQRLTDRIIEEGDRLTRVEQEVAYYDDLVGAIANIGSRPAGGVEAATLIKTQSRRAYASIGTAIDEVAAIYGALSDQNLNPSNVFYTITGPFAVQTQRSLKVGTVAWAFLLAVLLTLVFVPAACLIHHTRQQRARGAGFDEAPTLLA